MDNTECMLGYGRFSRKGQRFRKKSAPLRKMVQVVEVKVHEVAQRNQGFILRRFNRKRPNLLNISQPMLHPRQPGAVCTGTHIMQTQRRFVYVKLHQRLLKMQPCLRRLVKPPTQQKPQKWFEFIDAGGRALQKTLAVKRFKQKGGNAHNMPGSPMTKNAVEERKPLQSGLLLRSKPVEHVHLY